MNFIRISRKSFGMAAVALLLLSVIFVSCKKEDTNGNGTGTAATTFKVTDAPFDDASVMGAFVTIADIKLDGQSVQGFTKTTIDIAAFQNGATKTIGTFNLAGKTYNSVTFVLDFDTDASGNAPGSYVLTAGNIKHKLTTTSNVITVTKNFALASNSNNTIVADFDLRKMIVYQAGNPADRFDFATTAELQSDIRIVVENQTGVIAGTLTNNITGAGKVVAYVYKKGTFNRSVELQGQGSSNVQFKNAVSSSLVAANGTYQLHFLEAGAYEVYFSSYKDLIVPGQFTLQGTLSVNAANSVDFMNLNVTSNSTLTASGTVTAVNP